MKKLGPFVINTIWNPAQSVTEPSLSVSGRANGSVTTVSAGARSLSITVAAGATLATTVKDSSGTVSVTNSTATNPSWTAPSGSTTGNATQVTVIATKDGVSSEVSFTELISGSGGAGSYVTLKDLDLTDLTTVSAITSGSSTLQFESSDNTLAMTVTRFSSANGDVTPTNGQGILMNGGTGSGTVTSSFDIDALLSSYTRADVSQHVYAVHLVVTNVVYPNSGNSDIFTGLNKGNNTSHNSGEARGFFITDDGGNGDEETRVRSNTSNSSILSTTTIKTSRVFTYILIGGAIVEVMDTSGTTPPTPAPGGGSTITVGGDAVGLNDTTPIYQGDGLNMYFGAGDKTTAKLTRILVQRFQ